MTSAADGSYSIPGVYWGSVHLLASAAGHNSQTISLSISPGTNVTQNVTMTGPTNVGGAINTSTTWGLSGSPYVVTSTVSVGNGATLTISPGVVVKFNAGTALNVGSSGTAGTITAVGTVSQPITFTANGSTAPGFWRGVQLLSQTTSSSIIVYATIQYAGAEGSSPTAALGIGSSSPTIDHVTASNNIHAGIGVSGGAATLTNITASANPWGIIFWAGGTASLNGATISNNTTGGILVGGSPAPSPSIQNVALNNNSGFAIVRSPQLHSQLSRA